MNNKDLMQLDGYDIHFRLICSEDHERLIRFYYKLSDKTKFLRFQFNTANIPKVRVHKEAAFLCNLDRNTHNAIVAIIQRDNQEEIIGVARFVRDSETASAAEFAVVVLDEFQSKGLGKKMLLKLIDAARKMGINCLLGYLLSYNDVMIHLIKTLNLKTKIINFRGQIEAYIDISQQGTDKSCGKKPKTGREFTF